MYKSKDDLIIGMFSFLFLRNISIYKPNIFLTSKYDQTINELRIEHSYRTELHINMIWFDLIIMLYWFMIELKYNVSFHSETYNIREVDDTIITVYSGNIRP